MAEKVKITQEQAGAIDTLRKIGYSDFGIVVMAANRSEEDVVLDKYASLDILASWIQEDGYEKSDSLLDALRIGYEVEETFEVGDWVVVRWKDTGEKIYQVRESESKTSVEVGGGLFAPLDIVRHATPEEIKAEKERKQWAKIDRVPGDFQVGDIGIFKNEHVQHVDALGGFYKDGVLTGFYPSESFIKFEN